MNIKDKVFVVTGAGSGMGRQLAIQLVQKGAKVAMADIHEDTMKETAGLTQADKTSIHVVNITDTDAVNALPDQVIKEFGQIDGLINCAGIIQPFVDVKDLDFDTIERVMNINFYGTLKMIKAFLPYLLKRPEAHLANVSSMGGFIPFPGQSIYGASKAAIKLLTEALYAELKDTNVGVTIIFPGAVNTNIRENSGIQASAAMKEMLKDSENRAMPADKAAAIMIDAVEKNKLFCLVGKDSRMLNKIYRLNPKMAINMITKQMSKMVKK